MHAVFWIAWHTPLERLWLDLAPSRDEVFIETLLFVGFAAVGLGLGWFLRRELKSVRTSADLLEKRVREVSALNLMLSGHVNHYVEVAAKIEDLARAIELEMQSQGLQSSPTCAQLEAEAKSVAALASQFTKPVAPGSSA